MKSSGWIYMKSQSRANQEPIKSKSIFSINFKSIFPIKISINIISRFCMKKILIEILILKFTFQINSWEDQNLDCNHYAMLRVVSPTISLSPPFTTTFTHLTHTHYRHPHDPHYEYRHDNIPLPTHRHWQTLHIIPSMNQSAEEPMEVQLSPKWLKDHRNSSHTTDREHKTLETDTFQLEPWHSPKY